MRPQTEDERRERMGEIAYASAVEQLATRADNDCLADGLLTLDQYRAEYEQVCSNLLSAFPDLTGPEIGDLLYEAAGEVWPSVNHQL